MIKKSYSARIYLALLAMLGFASSCSNISKDIVEPMMYGTPSATFRAKVTVKNQRNEPIKDIEVSTKIRDYLSESGVTAVNGRLSYSTEVSPHQKQTITIYATDTDGPLNGGAYVKDSAKIEVLVSDFKNGDGAWNRGEVEKEVTIIMKDLPNK